MTTAVSAQFPCTEHFRNAANEFIRNGEWQQGLFYFDRYVNSGGVLNVYAYLDMANAHLAIGDTASVREDLSRAVDIGATWNEEEGSASIVKALPGDLKITPASIDYDRRRAKYLSKLDTALINKISEMVALDQFVRLNDRQTLSQIEFTDRVRRTDSLHIAQVKEIFLQHKGFPSDSVITRKAKFELTLMIQHFIRGFPETFDYFAEVVKEAIWRYQLHPSEYAVMFDRRQYKIDGRTIYGEVPYSKEAGVSSVDNIKNIDQVDSLRYSFGLGSLQQHSMVRGFELPEGYEVQRSPCLEGH